MMGVLIAVAILFTALYAQREHYKFLESKRSFIDFSALERELYKLRKEFEEQQKRVDALTLKAGFKL